MRHSRGIDVFPEVRKPSRDDLCLADLGENLVLSGKCGSCGRYSFIDRCALARRIGKQTPILPLAAKLKCIVCGNKDGNVFCASPMAR